MKRILTAREVLKAYNSSPLLPGGYGEDFGLRSMALKRHDDNPKLSSFQFTFPSSHRNLMNTVHGGALSTMIDVITTVALLRLTPNRTVSISLDTQFLSPIKPGEEVEIDTEICRMGRTMSFTECRIYTLANKERKLACKGQHIKAVTTEPWDFMKDLL
jgi:uncharacterized protein (TIGR00369 family)